MTAAKSFVVALMAVLSAGCDMHLPAKDGVFVDHGERERKAQLKVQRDVHMRAQLDKGTLGQNQVFPGSEYKDPRLMPRLPPPMSVVRASSPAPAADAAQAPSPMAGALQISSAAMLRTSAADGCVFKPVMSDSDIDACR
jgi:hypothetical protein